MADKILNSFDVWIAAQGWKSKLRLRSIDNINLEGIGRLRELILELAVRGKLLNQDQNDEPASLLLKRIASEKKVLINEGKISKQKSLPELGEEEKPFEVASGWVWCRMQDVSTYIQRGKGPIYSEAGSVQVISQKCIQWSGFDINKARFVDDSSIDLYQEERFLVDGDLLWNSTGTGTVGRINVLNEKSDYRLVADSHVTVIRPLGVNSRFLWCYLASPGIQSKITELGKSDTIVSGTTNQVELNTTSVIRLTIPLPPLAEQHRIVAKVDELMALCDELEQHETNHLKSHQLLVETLLGTLTQAKDAAEFQTAWATLAQHFDDLFITEDSIDQLKQTILQLAVMGKLVKQDPRDEPASVLLERIKKEKERLIEEGKIKKEKPLPQIANNEIPFELPDGWAWERLANLTEIITKGSSPKWQGISYTENETDVLFITSENVGSYKLLLNERKFVEPKFNEIEPRSILRKGDFLMNIVGGSIGRTAVYDIEDIANINQAVCLIRAVSGFINESYLLHFFNSEICISYMFDKQVDNARANLSMGNISNFVIPIPPIIEQTRIVAKVDELFALCDRLKERIGESQKVVNLMAEAVLEQV